MTKGKYAARAANRAVAFDNEVIVELRTKLAVVEAEREGLRNELYEERRQATAEVNRRVDAAVQPTIDRLNEARRQIGAAFTEWKVLVSDEVVELLGEWLLEMRDLTGQEAVIPTRFISPKSEDDVSFSRLFTVIDDSRAGELQAAIISYSSGIKIVRHARRLTARQMARKEQAIHNILRVEGGGWKPGFRDPTLLPVTDE